MIKQKKIIKMYDEMIAGKILTTEVLNGCGFTSKDIDILVGRGTLSRFAGTLYGFCDINGLYQYGKSLEKENNIKKAKECFKLCHKLAPENMTACFELFLIFIEEESFSEAFDYFKYLFHNPNKFSSQNDNNFYLCLFNILLDLPEEYVDLVKQMDFEDIRVLMTDCKYSKLDRFIHNHIRTSILHKKFDSANVQTEENIEKINTIQEYLTVKFIKAVRRKNCERLSEMTILVSEGKYEELKIFLEERFKRNQHNAFYRYYLMIANDLIKIKQTKEIPEEVQHDTEGVFEAIRAKKYELALTLEQKYMREEELHDGSNFLHLLLEVVCKEITVAKESYQAEYDFIIENMEKLKEKGLIVLTIPDNTSLENYKVAARRIPNVNYLGIGDNKLALLYFELLPDDINIYALREEGMRAYHSQDYDTCIDRFTTVFKYKTDFRAHDFALLGISYYKVGKLDFALDYLIVADALNKKDKDFSGLIEKIKKDSISNSDEMTIGPKLIRSKNFS